MSDPIETRLRSFGRERGVRVTVVSLNRGPCIDVVELSVEAICIEAIDNAARHGKPSAVRVWLTLDGEELVFAVMDDGSGFDLDEVSTRGGIARMERSAFAVGGEVQVRSRPGLGTTVIGRMPCPRPSEP
jgi:signal transduction histidine kinase